jgi:hypothetical protein
MRGATPRFDHKTSKDITADMLEDDDKRKKAIILLQRLLRGRAQ